MSTGLRLVFDARGDLRDAARACEAEVFRHRYRISPTRMRDEYDPYEDVSVWLVVARDDGEVIGSSRIIVPSALGFKSLADVSREPWEIDGAEAARAARLDLTRTWDVATLSRRHVLPHMPVTEALTYGIARGLQLNGVTGTVAILDATVRILLQRRFGLRYSSIPGTGRKYFMGSPSDPVLAHVPTLLDDARRRCPEGYRTITAGWGLDEIQLPSLDEHRLVRQEVDVRDAVVARIPSAAERRTG